MEEASLLQLLTDVQLLLSTNISWQTCTSVDELVTCRLV